MTATGQESHGGGGGSSASGGTSRPSGDRSAQDRSYLLGLVRGFGAAIIFSLPVLMTMEMWWLGFYMGRLRMAVAALLWIPLLIALSYFAGLRPNASVRTLILDAMSGYGMGLVAAAVVLFIFGVVTLTMAPRDIFGKIILLGLSASFGSMLGRSQLGSQADKKQEQSEEQRSGYWGQIFLELAGALYLSMTVAPTQEMVLIPYKMTPWNALVLVLASILLLHAFVYALRFKGAAQEQGQPWWSLLIRYSIPGYVIAAGVAAYLLWTFGCFEALNLYWMLMYTVVLGFPASVGAAAGRLIL